MKLYIFRPKGHGEHTFIVMADNEFQARELVMTEIKNDTDGYYMNSQLELLNSDYYKVEVYDVYQVATNDNE